LAFARRDEHTARMGSIGLHFFAGNRSIFNGDHDHQQLAALKLADRSAQLRAVGVCSAGCFP
jgi:hypothetical protein